MPSRKAVAGSKRSKKAVTSAVPKSAAGAEKSAVSREPITAAMSKTPKKASGAKRVSTVHLIGKRGDSARSSAVTR